MSSKQISPLLRTWYKWKALRLPWRKRFLVGLDLQGNTYWEFKDVRGDDNPNTARWRRIVQYPNGIHLSTVKVSPQWHQWLRHLREQPPTIQEQHAEVHRQMKMKYLAAEADARWEAKPKVMMDGPEQAMPTLESSRGSMNQNLKSVGEAEETTTTTTTRSDAIASPGEEQTVSAEPEQPRAKTAEKKDPWKNHRQSGPSEEWQPQAWAPPGKSR